MERLKDCDKEEEKSSTSVKKENDHPEEKPSSLSQPQPTSQSPSSVPTPPSCTQCKTDDYETRGGLNNLDVAGSSLDQGFENKENSARHDCKCELCRSHSNLLSRDRIPSNQSYQNEEQNLCDSPLLDDPIDEAFDEDRGSSASQSHDSPVENGIGGGFDDSDYVDEDIDFTKLQDVSQDDMERYFRENVHMLQRRSSSEDNTPETSPRNESLHPTRRNNVLKNQNGGSGTTVNGWHGNVTCTYPSSGHGIVTDTGYSNINGVTHISSDTSDSDEGGVYVLPEDLIACRQTKKHHHRSDDEDDDFIDEDIPRNSRYSLSMGSSNSNTNSLCNSNSLSLSRNSVSSSYEDLQTSNIQRPSSGDSNSGKTEDDETFTKLVFENRDNKDDDTDDYVHPWTRSRNDSESDSYSLPVPRPTNLFDSHVHCCGNKRKNMQDSHNIATCTSNSTSSSSPYTVSSAFISPQYSENSNLYNGVTSESSVFMSPDTSDSGTGSIEQRRQSFLRHQSMDYHMDNMGPEGCPLRSARSSGDLPNRDTRDASGLPVNERVPLIPKSHSHNIRNLCQRGQLPGIASNSSKLNASSESSSNNNKECNNDDDYETPTCCNHSSSNNRQEYHTSYDSSTNNREDSNSDYEVPSCCNQKKAEYNYSEVAGAESSAGIRNGSNNIGSSTAECPLMVHLSRESLLDGNNSSGISQSSTALKATEVVQCSSEGSSSSSVMRMLSCALCKRRRGEGVVVRACERNVYTCESAAADNKYDTVIDNRLEASGHQNGNNGAVAGGRQRIINGSAASANNIVEAGDHYHNHHQRKLPVNGASSGRNVLLSDNLSRSQFKPRACLSAPPTPPPKSRCLHQNCTCSLSYYFSCRLHGRGHSSLPAVNYSCSSSRYGETESPSSHVYRNSNHKSRYYSSSMSDHGDLVSNRAGDTTPVYSRSNHLTNNLSTCTSLFSSPTHTGLMSIGGVQNITSQLKNYSTSPSSSNHSRNHNCITTDLLTVQRYNHDTISGDDMDYSRLTSSSSNQDDHDRTLTPPPDNNISVIMQPTSNRNQAGRINNHTVSNINNYSINQASVSGTARAVTHPPPRMQPYVTTCSEVVACNDNSGAAGGLKTPEVAAGGRCAQDTSAQERQENENNTNIENGQLLQQVVHISDTTRDFNSHEQWKKKNQGDRDLDLGNMKDRALRAGRGHIGGDLSQQQKSAGRKKGIKILPLLLRSANTIDEMDPQAVMELFMQNDEDSEDDGYVDFHKMLRDYMEQKLYEKHSLASTWYSCEEERDLGGVQQTMIWSEYQAYLYHSRQIGVSACGATAVINVLKVFEVYPDEERVSSIIKTNLRAETASVPEYLISRSVAGTSAEELVNGISKLSHGGVYGKFFHFHPERIVCVRRWLSHWIKKGAVPVVTLNLQKAVPSGHVIPDAWHHQMVFGVGPQGVYLTNPQEIVPECVIKQQLCSESVLLIRRKDILSRWGDDCDMSVLMRQRDPRWRTMNVLGQAVNVLREEKTPHYPGFRPQLTSHISIPACYKSGVTLYIRKSNPAYKELRALPELAFKPHHKHGKKHHQR